MLKTVLRTVVSSLAAATTKQALAHARAHQA